MPNYSEWGRRVRDARAAKAWKQSELAAQSGLTQQAISYVERGLGSPTDDTRIRIANALGLRVEDLFPYAEQAAS